MNKDIVNSRTGVGVGIGAIVGFMFAGPFGAGVGALIGGGVAHASGDADKGVMTPKRQVIFTRAMESIKDPTELLKLADAYAGEGLNGQAAALRKRAGLRDLPQNVKETRRMAFRKAMACDDPDLILKIALAFENEASIDAAKTLREHADAVRAAHAAGKSAKPLTGGTQAQFADKLAKAIIHFGPASTQAQAAAKNLIRARGKTVSDELVQEVIRVSTEALKVEAPKADGPPKEPINIDPVPAAPEAEATGATGAPEPTVVGPAAGPLEPEVVHDGKAVEGGDVLPVPPAAPEQLAAPAAPMEAGA